MKKIITLLLLLPSFFSNASNDPDWLNRSVEIIKDPDSILGSLENMKKPTEHEMKISREILSSAKLHSKLSQPENNEETGATKLYKSSEFYLFLSFSIPEPQLKRIIRNVDTDEKIAVVFRGLKDKTNITGTMNYIQTLIKGIKPQPAVFLNPKPFETYTITAAPTILSFVGNEFISASGITNTQWLLDKKDEGKSGYLGIHGTTYPIAEESIIDTMKSRLATIDKDAIEKRIMDSYWGNYHFTSVLPVTENKKYLLDPSIHVKEDILTPDGDYIARKGQIINPLDIMPFTKTILVFNPNNKEEFLLAKKLSIQFFTEGKGLILLATELNTSRGWKHIEEIQSVLKHNFYLLNSEVQDRFHISRSPTRISSQGNRFLIEEIKVLN